MWTYNEHQIEGAEWALDTIREYGLAYLSWQERTRKTGTAILTIENSKAKTCLVVTKKKAISGWEEHLDNLPISKCFTVVNYESVHKLKGSFDIIILDESHHAISSIGRPSKTWKALYPYVKNKPILYLSATPYAEHVGLLYNQLKLSAWSPFRHKSFYDFFRDYGIPSMIRTPYGLKETYKKYNSEAVLDKVEHLFNFKTRKDVGIEHEPTVKVIEVPMSNKTKALIDELLTDSMVTIGEHVVVCDTPMKSRSVHYQLEGGAVKLEAGNYITTGELEKINYIKANYNLDDIAIMAHFIPERMLLAKYLPNVPLYSSDGDAEGVDLQHVKKLLNLSISFKTSKYTQRIVRQANHDRTEPIEVDIIVGGKPAIGYKVYEAVAIKKENFDKNSYERAIK